MFKKIAAALASMMFAFAAFAAVDVNKGTEADLDGIRGVGPTMSKRILDARKEGEFKSWDDFMARVKGVKAKKAAKLSADGLTVNGEPFNAAASQPPAPAAQKKTEKSAAGNRSGSTQGANAGPPLRGPFCVRLSVRCAPSAKLAGSALHCATDRPRHTSPMPLLPVIAVCVGASLGALMRWGLGLWLATSGPVAYGTLAANLVGGYLVGVAVAMFQAAPLLDPVWRLLLITGFLGGLTTFSSFSAEVVTLMMQGRPMLAFGVAGVHLAGSLALTWLGIRTVQICSQ
jgi:CrcB protein